MRPVVQGCSKLSEALGSEKFDSDEIEGGVLAFSALAYQERAEVNAWWLVGMWTASVSVPRIINAWSDFEEKKAKRLQAAPIEIVRAPAPVEAASQPALDLGT